MKSAYRVLPAMRASHMLAAICLIGCNQRSVPAAVDSDAIKVLNAISTHGARSVLDSASSDYKYDMWLYERIETGDSTWLEVARRLRPVESELNVSLDLTLARALPKAPERVLRLLGDASAGFSFDWVCRGEVYLDDEDTVKADSINKAYRREARRALNGVTTRDLLARRDACRKQIGPR